MKTNNKGFTLIEVIVSIAILGIVGSISFGFLTTSSKSYSIVHTSVNLQYKSQLAMNHIREYVVDTTNAVSFNDTTNTLYLINETEASTSASPKFVANIFEFSDNEILYSKANAPFNGTEYTVNSANKEVLTDCVSEFKVTFDTGELGQKVNLATILIKFELNEKLYIGEMDISLRNKPLLGTVVN